MSTRQVSATRLVTTTPEKIFDLLTDPAQHPVLDGSGTVRAARDSAPKRLALGSKFGMDMKMAASYRIKNTVVEFEEHRLIAWAHFGGHRWRWRLEPVDGGTKVTRHASSRLSRASRTLVYASRTFVRASCTFRPRAWLPDQRSSTQR